ncbi:MAG: carbon-nitrogen hydrolase family protein [Candidatus Hodarchaeales archaeon]|jgi:predicted amidohydrolase
MSPSEELVVVTLQPTIQLHDLGKNLNEYKKLFHEELTEINQIDVLCFPEYWNGLRINSITETSFSTSTQFLKDVAKAYTTWIIGGSLIAEGENQFYNRSLIINPKGEIIGKYDKQRLFGFEKTQDLIPGKSLFTWNIGNFHAGIRICNDLWNLNLVQELISREIDILFVPALTVVPEEALTSYGQYIWYNLAVIRAKEGAMVVVVSDTAKSVLSDPYWSTGASCIADPSQKFSNQEPHGANMLTTLDSGNQGIITKKISLQKLREQRTYRKTVGLMA